MGLSPDVTENKFGWECELNRDALADKINFIRGRSEELSTICTIAPGKIRADFDEDRLVKKYNDLFNSIVNGCIMI